MSEVYSALVDFTGFEWSPEAFSLFCIGCVLLAGLGFLHIILKIFSRYE